MVASKPIIAAIGNFDGVHLGHQYLLRETAKFAALHQASPGALLFDPHPRQYFRPNDPPFLLTSPAQRDKLLKDYGAEEIFVLTFDSSLATLSPEAFVCDILKDRLGLSGVVAGVDFRFGAERAGDADALKRFGEAAGLHTSFVEVIDGDSTAGKLGSSAVRNALRAGNVMAAAQMLGRPWSVCGVVTEGQKLGRTLGFPTANMTLGNILEPRNGVYATRVTIDGDVRNAVSNFGRRPTVGADAPLLETHVFDFDGDLYGKRIDIAFIQFVRDEEKFDGIDALKAQIARDCIAARNILA